MNRAISDALKLRLDQLAVSPPLGVAWPNRDFTPDGSDWLQVSIERAENARLSHGGATRFSGVLALVLCTALNRGSGEAESLADIIAAHFPVDLRLPVAGGGSVRVTTRPSVRSGYRDGAYWRTPILIPFEALAA